MRLTTLLLLPLGVASAILPGTNSGSGNASFGSALPSGHGSGISGGDGEHCRRHVRREITLLMDPRTYNQDNPNVPASDKGWTPYINAYAERKNDPRFRPIEFLPTLARVDRLGQVAGRFRGYEKPATENEPGGGGRFNFMVPGLDGGTTVVVMSR